MTHLIELTLDVSESVKIDRSAVVKLMRPTLDELSAQDPALKNAVVMIRRPEEQRDPDSIFETSILIHRDPTPYSAVGIGSSAEEAVRRALDDIKEKAER